MPNRQRILHQRNNIQKLQQKTLLIHHTQQKDKLKRKTQRKENKTKKKTDSPYTTIKDKENQCYICLENQILPEQQIISRKIQ